MTTVISVMYGSEKVNEAYFCHTYMYSFEHSVSVTLIDKSFFARLASSASILLQICKEIPTENN